MPDDPLDWRSQYPLSNYDVAQVCLNGHTITSLLRSEPEQSKPFCPRCGQPTIDSCKKCGFPIRGVSEGIDSLYYSPPNNCEHCGSPYPWSEKKIQAVSELASILDELNLNEKTELTKDLTDIASDNPRTTIAAAKLKKVLAKLGKETYQLAIKVVTDVATEAAKKQLGLKRRNNPQMTLRRLINFYLRSHENICDPTKSVLFRLSPRFNSRNHFLDKPSRLA